MKVNLPKGKYIVAVSGGVDSMVLLELLSKQGIDLVVAHFDHGIRPDSHKDEELVRQVAKRNELPFEASKGRLGAKASEEQARDARYEFLNAVKSKYRADKIITAHHQDDLIETAFINLIRGTGRLGLSSITNNPDIFRPLLDMPKSDITKYAIKHNINWREDPTNEDERYLRNFIRRQIMPKLSAKQRQDIIKGINKATVTNRLINQEVANLLQKSTTNGIIKRDMFIAFPDEISREVLTAFLRQEKIRQFDEKTIQNLTVAIKTAKPNTSLDVTKGTSLRIDGKEAHLVTSVKT